MRLCEGYLSADGYWIPACAGITGRLVYASWVWIR